MNDYDQVIGPELTITISPNSDDRIKELQDEIPCSNDDDNLPDWIADELRSEAFDSLNAFLKSKGININNIDIEEEYQPWVSKDEKSVTIGVSVSVLHNEEYEEKLENIFYSPSTDETISNIYKNTLSTILSEKFSWIEEKMIKVEIDGVGHG